MPTEFNTKDTVVAEPVRTMARCVKIRVPDSLCVHLEEVYPKVLQTAREMLENRELSSTKDWKLVPSVIAKALVRKYQADPKCRAITRLVLPISGDKGKQVKSVEGGLRVPVLFGKTVIKFKAPWPILGHIRSVEFSKQNKVWYMFVCCNTVCEKAIGVTGFVGVDRNSKGNLAVMADIQTGKVLKFGIDPAGTKKCMRGRRKNLQKAGKVKLLKRIKQKQSRRTTYENHRASKTLVNYAAKHCRAIVLEDLNDVRSKGSKIRKYTEKNQWAYAQLGMLIKYKAAVCGVPVLFVNAAFTSQMCSRCGAIHKTSNKEFVCKTCGHKEHRDANSAFNVGRLGERVVSLAGSGSLSVGLLGTIGGSYAGKEFIRCVD